MLQVGGAVEGQAQAGINDRLQRWNALQNLPRQNLADYIAAISGNYGGQSTSTQNTSGSPIGGAVGGGLLGMTIANSI
ncbi:hypothetical protein IAI27_11350, partial [Streptococcus pseudopneumoniae]|uniref:hypothetical protein n=1 Tax=Streptococcus pseudopneumoniae TaxID=257758 RepID=UPI0019D577E1